jgi:RND family efflux transporter MFP subunit
MKLPASCVLGLLMVVLTGCRQNPAAGKSPSLPPLRVRTAVVESRPRTVVEEVMGSVRSRRHASVEAKVMGKVESMFVVPGQEVKPGEVLAELDAKDIKARLDQMRAIREQASQEYRRAASLLKETAVSQQEFDLAQSKARVAEAAVVEAETTVGYARIVAPFSGVVTRKLAEVGDLAAPGKSLLELEDPLALRLEADVPEALMGRIKIGDKLAVRLGSSTNELEGITSEITPVVDPGSRTFLVKLDLPQVEGVRTGQFGRVQVPVGEGAALRVPLAAVIQRGQMELAFVVQEGRAHLRLIKTAKHIGGEVEVVAGLEANEQIVIDQAGELLDGQPVLSQ